MNIVTLQRLRSPQPKQRVRAPQWFLIDLPLLLAGVALVALVLYAAWWAR